MPTAVLDCRAPLHAVRELKRRGMHTLLLPPHPFLPPPVASHPDLLLFFTGQAIYTTGLYSRIAKDELKELSGRTGVEIRVTEQELGGTYPQDILLDAAQIGDLLFCLPAHTAPELMNRAGIRTVPVRQGYAKCSVLPVGQRAVITADSSIASAAQNLNVDLLRIRPGSILLPGYDTGFIGGASSFAPYGQTNEIFFCGDPLLHPSGAEISGFCRSRGTEPIALSNAPLTDIGTIFIL